MTNNKPVLKLSGTDGNAFLLLGKARLVAYQHKMDWEKIKKEAMMDDYHHLIAILDEYFTLE